MGKVGGTDSVGGGSADPRDPRHLQPSDCPSSEELLAAHDDQATLRRLNDQRLRDALSQEGFAGPNYDRWREDMAGYAIAVLNAWIYTGRIFNLCLDRGYGLVCNDTVRDALRRDKALRNDLAVMTVAKTFTPFRERSLITGKWTADGGASLPTYFMGATLYQFPNTYRTFLTEHSGDLLRGRTEDDLETHRDKRGSLSTEEHVLGDLGLCEILDQFPPETQVLLRLTADGYRQAEIAEILGTTERAVEGVLYRARNKLDTQYPGRRSTR